MSPAKRKTVEAAHFLPLVSGGGAHPVHGNSGMWERAVYCRDDKDGGKRFLCDVRGDSDQNARDITDLIVRATNSHDWLMKLYNGVRELKDFGGPGGTDAEDAVQQALDALEDLV